MAFFKKKEEEETEEAPSEPEEEKEEAVSGDTKAEIIRIKAQIESFGEVRKATNERFTRISEQMGELRGMIIDTNKMMQQIEVKTVKAVDLVEAIKPDKFMVDLRKQDAKVEALKANIESNETMMKSIMNEIKELRNKFTVFRGVEDVIKLNKEIKEDIMNVKKIKAVAERHSDKIEGIFIEIQKRVARFDTFESTLKELNQAFKKIAGDFDVIKLSFNKKANKKEVEDILSKFKSFENEYGKVIKILELNIDDYRNYFEDTLEKKFAEADKLMKVIKDLGKDSPNLEKNLKKIGDLVKEHRAQKEQRKKQEKKEGAEEKEKKPSFFKKLVGKKKEDKEEGKEEEKKE